MEDAPQPGDSSPGLEDGGIPLNTIINAGEPPAFGRADEEPALFVKT
jgi:hypothetical protein